MIRILEGQTILPQTKKIERAIIFLHGYGANGKDLISIGHSWEDKLRETLFLSPNAPFECPWGNNSYQWFELTSISPENISKGLLKAGPYLNEYIDWVKKEFNLSNEKIFFVTFSQGTMMALYHLCKRNEGCAGIMGYSGMLFFDALFCKEVKSKFPIRLYHGKDDDVIDSYQTEKASEKFKSLNFDVDFQIKENLGHGIDETGLEYGLNFIKKTFNI